MQSKKKRQLVEESILSSYESMYRIAFTYVKNQEDALDIVQDSACRAIQYADSVKNQKYVQTWLFRIVINCALDFIKRQKKEITIDNPEYYIHESTWDSYENLDLKKALDKLNTKEKSIILLRFFEDKKIEEIAEVLKLKENTVKSILYRGVRKLENEMTKGEDVS